MESYKYMESDTETQERYIENLESERLITDLGDIIQRFANMDNVTFAKKSHEQGITVILNELRKRLDDADTTNAAKHLLSMGFDQDKNSTRDFIQAVRDLKKMAYK